MGQRTSGDDESLIDDMQADLVEDTSGDRLSLMHSAEGRKQILGGLAVEFE
jgi:hypothetical protein